MAALLRCKSSLVVALLILHAIMNADVAQASDHKESVSIDMQKNRNVGVGFDLLTYETVSLGVTLKTDLANPFAGAFPRSSVEAKDGELLWRLVKDTNTTQERSALGLQINDRFSVRFKARLGGGAGPGPGDPVFGWGSVADVDIDVDTLGLRSDAATENHWPPDGSLIEDQLEDVPTGGMEIRKGFTAMRCFRRFCLLAPITS